MSPTVELLLMRHRSPELWDAGTVGAALAMAENVEADGAGSSVAVLIENKPRHVHGPETGFRWKPASDAPELAERALALAAEARAYEAEAERRHGDRRRETR